VADGVADLDYWHELAAREDPLMALPDYES
jgi:hypothetical protein